MKICYCSNKVEKYFSDYAEMCKKVSPEWVRSIKKHIDNLRASDTFGIFLGLGLGHPEQLISNGSKYVRYSVRVNANVRLVMRLMPDDRVEDCEKVYIEGVMDYHGSKENWYIR